MRTILHYSLGFPPYRTGGLTKCSYDLMCEQVKEGFDVCLLWPGKIEILKHKTRIRKDETINGIKSYEIINPLPVPYDEGIVEINRFLNDGDKEVYTDFLKEVCPDVIHIHTLMGLHKNFLVAAKQQGIRIIFTTHDLFPICPKVTMFRNGDICTTVKSCSNCPECNMTALSEIKMQILQSSLYRRLKDSSIIKNIRKSQRDEYLSESVKIKGNPSTTNENYLDLREHYKSMLTLMDFIHYNSTLTKSVYDRYIGPLPGKVIPITHADIDDHRTIKDYNHKTLHLTYLGPQGGGKGFFRLKAVLDELWEKRQDFFLNVYFRNSELPPYIKQHDRYSYDQLSEVMSEADVVITPSVWYETFGYTVLEALSYGVPVIASDHVGAKDIIPKGGGIIFNNELELRILFSSLTLDKLSSMNKLIIRSDFLMDEKTMFSKINEYGYTR